MCVSCLPQLSKQKHMAMTLDVSRLTPKKAAVQIVKVWVLSVWSCYFYQVSMHLARSVMGNAMTKKHLPSRIEIKTLLKY